MQWLSNLLCPAHRLLAGLLAMPLLFATLGSAAGCLPEPAHGPFLEVSSVTTVTFHSKEASPLDLIHAIGYQTRTPIGIVLGYDLDALTRPRRAYALDKVEFRAALAQALEGTGYRVKAQSGVWDLVAGDLTTRQQTILDHQFTDFAPGTNQTMAGLSLTLWMWIGSVVDPEQPGYGGSLLGSTDDERFTVAPPGMATTEQIANLIVSQGSRGIWTLKLDPSVDKGVAGLSFTVEPYQHRSRAPVL